VLYSADFKIFLQTAIIMKQTNHQQLKWELARERFRIEDPLPPPQQRPERCIRDIAAGILQEAVLEPALPAGLGEHWPVIAGGQLAQHTCPAHLKNGILYVYADHPGWLAEVRRLPKTHLLGKIASLPGIPEIKDIRFQLEPAI
jgi:predicted nucleic acid-binding Zn ribbon protein